jgi:hypothetical protein
MLAQPLISRTSGVENPLGNEGAGQQRPWRPRDDRAASSVANPSDTPMTKFYRLDAAHPAPPRPTLLLPEVALEIVRGQARQRLRPVAATAFLIGAANDCDLVLGDHRFADVHSYLFRRPGQVTLRRLGFEPELSVNGQVVDFVSLADGDRIRTGPFEFRIHITRSSVTGADSARLTSADTPLHTEAAEEVRRLLADVRASFPKASQLSRRLTWPPLAAECSRTAG